MSKILSIIGRGKKIAGKKNRREKKAKQTGPYCLNTNQPEPVTALQHYRHPVES